MNNLRDTTMTSNTKENETKKKWGKKIDWMVILLLMKASKYISMEKKCYSIVHLHIRNDGAIVSIEWHSDPCTTNSEQFHFKSFQFNGTCTKQRKKERTVLKCIMCIKIHYLIERIAVIRLFYALNVMIMFCDAVCLGLLIETNVRCWEKLRIANHTSHTKCGRFNFIPLKEIISKNRWTLHRFHVSTQTHFEVCRYVSRHFHFALF